VWVLLASVSIALLLGSLSGCAGVVAIVRGSSDFQLEQPELSSHHRGIPARAEHLVGAFGEPNEIIALGPDRERWRYRTGLRFHGVAVLLIVIPLPLLVPTGVHDTYVEIEQGTVVQVRGSQNSDVARIGCTVGVFASIAIGDRGCFAKRGAPPKQAPLGSGVMWLGPPPSLKSAPSGPR
jgi:hypothetical protein